MHNEIDSAFGLVQIVERLHRHFLDVLRVELRRIGVEEINAVQALLLANIGTEEVVIRDLRDRGYYHGSNVSYNIKKLTEMGYITQERSPHDRRAVRVGLTEQGMRLRDVVRELQGRLAKQLRERGLDGDAMQQTINALSVVEGCWTDYVRRSFR